MLSKDNKLPLYHQLADKIIQHIEDLNLNEHDKIPSEREFCEKYNISRATVRQAIAYLEKKEYLYKIQGKGTFISPKIFKQNLLKFYSFSDETVKKGKNPTTKLLDFEIINADKIIANGLNVSLDEKVYHVKRLRLADDEPMMVESSYLNFKRFPRLRKEDFIDRSMYDLFIKEYNVELTRAVERFTVKLVNNEEATYLNYEKGSPGIKLERITYDNDEIIEYTISCLRGDKFQFEIELNNN